MENFDIRKELLDRIRAINPLDFVDMLFYVAGVVLLIYAVMQLVHGLEGKDAAFRKRGLLFSVISLVLVLQRLVLRYLGVL